MELLYIHRERLHPSIHPAGRMSPSRLPSTALTLKGHEQLRYPEQSKDGSRCASDAQRANK